MGIVGNNTKLFFGYKSSNVTIGNRIILANQIELLAKGELSIGSNFSMSEYSRIVSHGQIHIGNHVTIARFVSILDHDHHCELKNGQMVMTGYDVSSVTIGNNVWIGDKVTILRGAEIGSNCIIASNSVVKGYLEGNAIYGGIPAKKIKELQ